MAKQNDLIRLQEAIKEFQVARMTLIRALDAGHLKRFRRGGDRNVYVSRSAVKVLRWRSSSGDCMNEIQIHQKKVSFES